MAKKTSVHTVTSDIAQQVTDMIVERLQAGTVPWHQSWNAERAGGSLPRSLSTGKAYRGVNVFLLELVAQAQGYTSNWWGTYNQITERGGQVRKGEKGTLVVFWKRLVIEEDGEKKVIPLLKSFKVFNSDQADGVKLPEGPAPVAEFEAVAACDQAVKAYYAAEDAPGLRHGSTGAFYSPSADYVSMPERVTFDSPEEYYGVLFHETVHSTGHASRLARKDLLEMHRFGDENYSREELTAEMGSAMLSAFTGVAAATIDNSAAYIANWLKALQDDPKLVVVAAGKAHAAAEYILAGGVKPSYDD